MDKGLGRLVPAVTLEHAEAMCQARNECRMFMTKDTHEITPAEQELWWATLDRSAVRPFVFALDKVLIEPKGTEVHLGPVYIGYGLIRRIDRDLWISGGLVERWRYQGFGRQLFEGLADIVNRADRQRCWLEVRATNGPARRLYQSLGFYATATNYEGGLGVTITMGRDP